MRAVVTEVGAALRELSVDGVALTPGYRSDVLRPHYSGTVLVPWPNRVRDARWIHDGVTQLLDVTEPEAGNALHGLLCFTAHRELERADDSITLAASVFPQRGYPFHLDTRVRYAVVADGLHVTHTMENVGAAAAPVAIGAHPFLCIGEIPTETLILSVSAQTHIDVDERRNPVGLHPVAGSRWDLRRGVRVGDLDLDDSWTDLQLVDGGSTHSLRAPDGRTVTLWADDQFGCLHVFTTRKFPQGTDTVTAIAIEPMTAPADAFNSGTDLRWLRPDQQWSASWAIRYAATPS